MSTRTPRLTNLASRLRRAVTRFLIPPLLAAGSAFAAAPDRLTLLVPDGADLNSWQVKVWTDSAAEEGVRIEILRDAAFLAMGNSAASKVSGLIVPDSAHIRASGSLVTAIKQYAYLGGKLMLVYDAGVLTDSGFYPATGNSRFADMVGVDYAFWNNGLGANTIVGYGPMVGTKARLESLSFPPGKYLPYVAPASLSSVTNSTGFVPTSQLDPGGSLAMQNALQDRASKGIEDGSRNVRAQRQYSLRELLGLGVQPLGPVRFDRRNAGASAARDWHIFDRAERKADWVDATLSSDLTKTTEKSVVPYSSTDASLQAVSGYAFGPTNYFHYVTTGTFPGTVYLSSPEHGLVAGSRSYGSGQLLYVNLPLGYFKAIGTDSAPLHGFLNLFARDHVGVPRLSVQPNGKGGIIYNWHVDDGDDLLSDVKNIFDSTDVLETSGPFSIHFTAGPDVINFGDGMGMNLENNTTAQALVRKLRDLGVKHELGSHGGWIHDYWGLNAKDPNSPDLTWLLSRNFDAIERVTGRKIREYSAPAGNNPAWAVRWLEARGVVAYYTVGDGGAAAIRPWRNGARLTDKLWAFPVAPNERYATFEEFDAFGVPEIKQGQWLLDLQSFVVNQRTNRLFYNHPPGARDHKTAVQSLLTRANNLKGQNKFKWYTMTEMADFSQRRLGTSWSKSTNFFGFANFEASNSASLDDMTWLLPRSRYGQPWVIWGFGSVSSDSQNWIVTANGGTSIKFFAEER